MIEASMVGRPDEVGASLSVTADHVAVVGIGCRYPGGITDARSFWEVLASGVDAIGDIPADRWHAEDFHDPNPETPGRMTVRQGGFLNQAFDEFDAGFFGLTPREAAALDPQQRLLMEVTWEAFEDAGIAPSAVAGSNTGVYIGGFTFDAATLQLGGANRHLVNSATPTGVSMTMLAARLSYTFDLRGPCLTIDTACSSSLVALHNACSALARHECDAAIAGGVNVMVNPVTTILMSKGQFLSPDARCRSFDHRANGYARGEGAGVLLLKPLSTAIRDKDRVYAVIRGTAVNQDGRTPGITVPSAAAQSALIRRACAVAGVEPQSVGYFEAHGTGTAVGDPVEAAAIGESVGDTDVVRWMGSVKSNFGHTEAAAGVAGLIKACLCLEHSLIPPNLHFQRPNPAIPFGLLPLRIPTETVPFPALDGPRRAGVNSFGFGGTNAHAILEQAPAAGETDDEADDGRPQLLPISARSNQALRALADGYVSYLETGPALRQVCRAAARSREHHPLRAFVVSRSRAEAAERLRALTIAPKRTARAAAVFVFTGMGPQWWGMGRELLLEESLFAEVVDECDAVLAREGMSIRTELLRAEPRTRLTRTLYAQVANFVVQAGLASLWRHWGVEPAAIVGHSVGEVAAAYAAGVYSLEDALTVSYHRARLQSELAGRGGMVAVALPADEVSTYLVDGVVVAAVNSPTTTTLAGDAAPLAEMTKRLDALGVPVRTLRVEVAYHSPVMDEIRKPLITALRAVTPRAARVALYSTVTGQRSAGTDMGAQYWWGNVREPVLFGPALRRLLAECPETPGAVLELGPHPVLAAAIDETLTEAGLDASCLASLRRDRPQREQMLETLGELYIAGVDPDWPAVHPGLREHIDIPCYPWQREPYWVESATSRRDRLGAPGYRLAGRPVAAVTPTHDIELSLSGLPYLCDHRIGDEVVFPGSGYLEVALAMFPDDQPLGLSDIRFHRPLGLPTSSVTTLRASYDSSSGRVTLHGRSGPDDAWTMHAALTREHLQQPRVPDFPARTLAESTRWPPDVTHDHFYKYIHGTNLRYGPAFRAVDRLWYDKNSRDVFAQLRLGTTDQEGYRVHPVVLDAALQAMVVGAALLEGEELSETFLPASIDRFRFYRSPGRDLLLAGRARLSQVPDQIECDLTLLTDNGDVVAEVIGLRAQRLAANHDQSEPDVHYRNTWRPEPLQPSGDAGGTWVVVSSVALAENVARELAHRGGTPVRIAPEDEDGLASMPAARGVVYVHNHADRHGSVCAPVEAVLRLVQAIPVVGMSLTFVTWGAQSTDADDPTTDPSAAALWGFGRVVAAERPELRCQLVDVDPSAGDDDAWLLHGLVDEVTHGQPDEVALRRGERYVRRLEPVDDRTPPRCLSVRTNVTPVRLRRDGTGGLRFAATTRREPGPTEVEIAVAYVGLNFKDVLKVNGLLAPYVLEGSHSGSTIGLECSGTVTRVGTEVSDLRPGHHVFAHSRDLFASYVTLEAQRVVRTPQALTQAQAASLLPVATAYLSLTDLARVLPGDRVLIHSAAGGVGLAAVRLASQLGAQVYATAGSEARRRALHDEGVTHVGNSRSTSFADDVLSWTGGQGVDVVLSSLPGEMLPSSLRVLRTFGRFVELGKPANILDPALRAESARRALSFHSVDYDQMMAQMPQRVRAYMQATADLYERGVLRPLPVTEVPADAIDESFAAMTRPSHAGKIAVRLVGEHVTVQASTIAELPIALDATYVITGGLGGLGRTVARWLTERGARHLVLISRGGAAAPEAIHLVTALSAEGVTVRVEQADVADRAQVAASLGRARALMPPIRGIVHAAASFDDAMLSETTPARLVEATRPKADGAWNLHLETMTDTLDFFVLFSSVAAQLGAAGAGAYATANEFLNALARHRRAQGLPALSIGWGMVDELGVAVSRDGYVGSVLRRNGHVGISPARLLREFETLLRTQPVEASVAHIDWSRWARANPQLATLPTLRANVPAAVAEHGGASPAQQLRSVTPAGRTAMLPTLVAPTLRAITGLTDEQLAADQAVDIDSLSAVELRIRLQRELDIAVPAVRLQRSLTLNALAELVSGELDRVTDDGPGGQISAHVFASADGLTVHGHLSLPVGPGPHPAVVVCTAGEGGALNADGEYVHVGEHEPLRAAGLAVFTVDHRGAPGHGADFRARAEMGGADIDDVVAARRYLATVPSIDATHISILGTSRGAYSALLALERTPDLWHRAVLLMGFYDAYSAFLALQRTPDLWHRAALLMGLYDPAVLVSVQRSRSDGPLPVGPEVGAEEIEEYFADPRRQPLMGLASVTTPLLIVHGDADAVIPLAQAEKLAARTRELGRPATLLTVPRLGHDSEHATTVWTDLWPRITDFLTERRDS